MTSQRLITAFWQAATDPDVGDLLFARATDLESARRRTPHTTAVSPAVADRYYKGPLGHVLTIVTNPASDPAILARFAKDTRVSVRRALIENPATPQPTVRDLALWALDRTDESVPDVLARLGLDEIVALPQALRERRLKVRFAAAELGASEIAARATGDPSKAVALAALGNLSLTVELAVRAHAGQLAGVTFTDLLATHPEATTAVVDRLLRERRRLSVELAGTWMALSRTRRQPPISYQGYDPVERFTEVEPGAPELLVREAHTIGQFLTGVVHGAADETIRRTVEEPSCHLAFVTALVDALSIREVSPETERALVARAVSRTPQTGDYGRFRPADLLTALRHPLDDSDLLALLRRGNFETTRTWLTRENLVNRPRPGLVVKLWRRQGDAFSDSSNVREATKIREWLRDSLVEAAARDEALLDDLVTLHDQWLGAHLGDSRVARAVWPIVSSRFDGKDKLALWETFIALAGDWQDSFTALLDTCSALSGEPVTDGVDDGAGHVTHEPGATASAGPLQLSLM